MQKTIPEYSELIFDFLMNEHEEHSDFLFVPRIKDKNDRFSQGYWFIGNPDYLQVSFWEGRDSKERIHNISFTVLNHHGQMISYIEISSQDSDSKAKYLEKMLHSFANMKFERQGEKKQWRHYYPHESIISSLKSFVQAAKPQIDTYLKKHPRNDITFVKKETFDKYVARIQGHRARLNRIPQDKIARICWNANGWRGPSGAEGKSSAKESYESSKGFGHEEWLFDRSRTINGYHYGFLRPLHLTTDMHVGRIYNITLFTIKNRGPKCLVGEIRNAECISGEESTSIFAEYKKNGWFDEMVDELENVGADYKAFRDMTYQGMSPERFVNVKFHPHELIELDGLEVISKDDRNITTTRFKLLNRISDIKIQTVDIPNTKSKDKSTTKQKRIVEAREIEIDPYHNRIQNTLKRILLQDSDYRDVYLERDRVDLQAMTNTDETHFFEVKTAIPKAAIRQAMGQILEYAYYPDGERADRLFIIGTDKPDDETKRYIQYIRNSFGIPVYYRAVDMEKDTLSEEY